MKNYHTNPKDWLMMNLRSRLLRVLNGGTKKMRKSSHSFKLFGANVDTIKQHIESQFKSGMSWDNRGKWHIDHIRPISSFDLTKRKQQGVAFHYKNLQPLWAKENLVKSNKFVIK